MYWGVGFGLLLHIYNYFIGFTLNSLLGVYFNLSFSINNIVWALLTNLWMTALFNGLFFAACTGLILYISTGSRVSQKLRAGAVFIVIFSCTRLNLIDSFESIFGFTVLAANTNLLLLNPVNWAHPLLIYITAALLLISIWWAVLIAYIRVFIVLGGAGLFLGSWWAEVEGSWGGWWAWDPSELLSLITISLGLWWYHRYLVHATYLGWIYSTANYKNLGLLCWAIYIFILQNFILLASHNFNNQICFIITYSLVASLYLLCTLIVLYIYFIVYILAGRRCYVAAYYNLVFAIILYGSYAAAVVLDYWRPILLFSFFNSVFWARLNLNWLFVLGGLYGVGVVSAVGYWVLALPNYLLYISGHYLVIYLCVVYNNIVYSIELGSYLCTINYICDAVYYVNSMSWVWVQFSIQAAQQLLVFCGLSVAPFNVPIIVGTDYWFLSLSLDKVRVIIAGISLVLGVLVTVITVNQLACINIKYGVVCYLSIYIHGLNLNHYPLQFYLSTVYSLSEIRAISVYWII